MTRLLELIGWKRAANPIPLFTSWHSLAAVLIAAVVIAGLLRVL